MSDWKVVVPTKGYKVVRHEKFQCPWCDTTVDVPVEVGAFNYQGSGHPTRSTGITCRRAETIYHECPGPT
jgi:hypothetical protein